MPARFRLPLLLVLPIAMSLGANAAERPAGPVRVKVGEVELTALSDGQVDPPAGKRPTGAKTAPVNAYLVATGGRQLLVDRGTGGLGARNAGLLMDNLKAAGSSPEQVEQVLITHMASDHVGGLAPRGRPAFPKAIVRAGKAEVAFWLDQGQMDRSGEADKPTFIAAMNALTPYSTAGRLEAIEGSDDIVPGIRPLDVFGQTVYVIESQGQRLMALGDLIQLAPAQVKGAEGLTVVFESDAKVSAASRAKAFAQAARAGDLVAATHLPYPGIGRLKASGSRWSFVPLSLPAVP